MAAVGPNSTLTDTLPPGASVSGRNGWATGNCTVGGATSMPVIVSGALPTLVITRVLGALAVRTTWLPKSRAAGLTLMTGAVPLPLSATACGAPAASLPMLSVALRVPGAVGAKVAVTGTEPPAGTTTGMAGPLT